MNDAATQDQPIPVPDTVEIDDLNGFVQILIAWHAEKCGVVQHLLSVPEGTAFEIDDRVNAEQLILSGDTLKGFKFGIEMAMMQLGTLPFVAEFEDAPVAP